MIEMMRKKDRVIRSIHLIAVLMVRTQSSSLVPDDFCSNDI